MGEQRRFQRERVCILFSQGSENGRKKNLQIVVWYSLITVLDIYECLVLDLHLSDADEDQELQ